MIRHISRLLTGMFALMIIMGIGTANTASANDNLLQNPGFEGNYSAWLPQYNTAQVAANWTPWWTEDADRDPIWAQPEYKPAHKHEYANRVFEGDTAQQWFTFHKSHRGGMYQQVRNVTPGQTYRFSIWVQVWASTDDDSNSDSTGDPAVQIGIDPTGAAHPGNIANPPSSIVWSDNAPMLQVFDQWYQMSIDVVAQNSTITVYMQTNPPFAIKHNDYYFDAASLTAVNATAPVPAPISEPVTDTTPAPAPADNGNTAGCVIPSTGPWPPCATGGTATDNWTNYDGQVPTGSTNTAGCVIPSSGPWPPCATGGNTNAGTADCPIPPSGPWPACATGGSVTTQAPQADTVSNPEPTPVAQSPAPSPQSPTARSGFGLGGQTHTLANPNVMLDSGMTWVKFQHKWSEQDSPNAVANRISDAQGKGFKVLLSIPGADHSSIDYAKYVEFLRGVASLNPAPDAIEVWNEMNIDREWPAGQISGTTYTNQMLKPAYQAIKGANSNVMVISGAPAPTGFFGGCGGNGCDDSFYLDQMAAAGAANYMDCVGVHYNEGILSPHARSGDPRGNSSHYTRYYGTMVDVYYNAFGGAKPLCFTELGYLSGEDFGGLPGGFAWANDTSVDQHAQWLGEAVAIARQSAQVEMLIIFNVDFTLFEPDGDPQAGFAMIRKNGGCPACTTVKAAMQ